VKSEEPSNNSPEEPATVSPRPGTVKITGQGQPLVASRIPNGSQSSAVCTSPATLSAPKDKIEDSSHSNKTPPTDGMRVLVAEDDQINSRIIDKRLSKLGHDVHLTSNGEECVYAYREAKGNFDIVLMDIQVRLRKLEFDDDHTEDR
jgi:CheY-like chemotaxis protein